MTVSDAGRDTDIVEGDEPNTPSSDTPGMEQLSPVTVEKMRVLRELSHGDYFGEKSLLREERRSANVIAVSNVEVWLHFNFMFSIFIRV